MPTLDFSLLLLFLTKVIDDDVVGAAAAPAATALPVVTVPLVVRECLLVPFFMQLNFIMVL